MRRTTPRPEATPARAAPISVQWAVLDTAERTLATVLGLTLEQAREQMRDFVGALHPTTQPTRRADREIWRASAAWHQARAVVERVSATELRLCEVLPPHAGWRPPRATAQVPAPVSSPSVAAPRVVSLALDAPVRDLLMHAGLVDSQRAAAEALGVSQPSVNEAIKRGPRVGLDLLIRWAEALGFEVVLSMTYNRNRGGEGMGINERFGAENVEEPQAPPAWLTAAVLAALPGDGTPRDLMGIHNQASIAEYPRCRDKVPAVLAHLVSTGEIEAIEGGAQWRRWGVPEGWAWARMAADNGDMLEHDGDIVADVGDDGRWAAFPATPVRSAIEQHEITRGRAETPAAARQAALRACHERGIFGPRPAPTLTTSTPQGAGMGEQVAIAKAIAGAAPTEPPAQPVVAFRHDPDDGPRWHVRLGAYQGPERGNRHLADLDADAIAAAMQAALSGPLGVAARVAALLASPEARDAVAGRCAAPASAVLATLRWVVEGPPLSPVLEWGDVPTLASEGMAVVVDGEDEA